MNINRRQFLELLVSLPAAYMIPVQEVKADIESHLSPEDSLKKLIFVVGPWPADDRKEAEDFARRFLKSEHATGGYLQSGELLQSLARRFPETTMAIKEIDLHKLPAEERDLLMNLVKQIYNLIEVKFYVSHEPPWGECEGERTRYIQLAPGNL